MNNKILILVLLLVISCVVYQTKNITGYSILHTGEKTESGGHAIKIIKISPNNIIIDVDGAKSIVTPGDDKVINGVKIKIINIFHVEEEEERSVDIAINVLETDTISCGDEKCESGENSNNCCKDCGCQTGYKCEEDKCVYSPKSECRKHEDCEDNNPDTIDLCVDLTPKVCKHYSESEIEASAGLENKTNNQIEAISEDKEEKSGFFDKIFLFFKNWF